MDIFLAITIDVEPDCSPTWHYSDPLTFEGVKIGIKEILQPLFNKYDIKPTYLINNVVLEDEESVKVFKYLEGDYELGTHLHPEFIEPEKIYYDYAGKKGEKNQCFFQPEIEYEKIKNITDLFRDKFGNYPQSFRAGRFSAGANTIKSLEKLNYKVDTSVTPRILWNDKTREKAIDFSNVNDQPFFVKSGSFFEKDDNGKVLEVPVSIINYRQIFRRKNIWLRPYYSNYGQMKIIIDYLIKKYLNSNVLVLNMMFHNVEVLKNKSPYTKTDTEVKKYLSDLENFISYCHAQNIHSKKISDLYEIFT